MPERVKIHRKFTGGLPLRPYKALSTGAAASRLTIPKRLCISMQQQSGAPAMACVTPGERVERGQLIGVPTATLGAAVHASACGRVHALEQRPVPTGSRLVVADCVVIDTDPEPGPASAPGADHWPGDRAGRLAAIRRAGIVGLGGAAFPTADKLSCDRACETLILNGAECEPYISCDDMLMRETPDSILAGAAIMLEIACASRCIVAIERDKIRALETMADAVRRFADERFTMVAIPTIYPAGGERQLVEMLLGLEVPSGGHPIDIGVVCQNVGTAHALANFVASGQPLLSRIVTVTGRGVEAPQNVHAPIGALIGDLLAHCGGLNERASRLILGGNMMGYSLPTADIPITKSTNCVVALTAEDVRDDTTEWPCIRCGECAAACPARLLPQELLRAATGRRFERLTALGLVDCIECGCCDVVCPSHILLTARFRAAKIELAEHRAHARLADAADERYLRRKDRQLREADAARHEQDELKARLAGDEASRRAALSAAVERARGRKRSPDEPE